MFCVYQIILIQKTTFIKPLPGVLCLSRPTILSPLLLLTRQQNAKIASRKDNKRQPNATDLPEETVALVICCTPERPCESISEVNGDKANISLLLCIFPVNVASQPVSGLTLRAYAPRNFSTGSALGVQPGPTL